MQLSDILIHPRNNKQIAQGLLFLASVCDGAQSLDGQGFDGAGKDFGHSLAAQIAEGKPLTRRQQQKAFDLLQRHRKQLERAGYELPTQAEFEEWNKPQRKQPDELTVTPDLSDTWVVTNETKGTQYEVYKEDDQWACNCPSVVLCKHIKAVWEFEGEDTNIIEFPTHQQVEEPRPIELITTKSGLVLNEQQSEAVHKIVDWFLYDSDPQLLVQGYAGTGKSTCVWTAIDRILVERPNTSIVCCAPTNKATQVLRKIAAEQGQRGADFATAHQLMGLTLTVDDDGNERVTSDGNGTVSIGAYDLVICDEASMINKDLWKLLNGFTRGGKPKLLLMGDPAQLPPVGENESEVFQLENKVELTQVMRHGGPILELVTEIRERLNYVKPVQIRSDIEADRGVHLLDKFEWLDRLVADYQSEEYKNNPEFVRALAWTNKAVAWINNHCRWKINGTDVPQFVTGERLIANKPILETEQDRMANDHRYREVIMTTSSECTILECSQMHYRDNRRGNSDVWLTWEIYALLDTGRVGKPITIMVLDESERQRLIDSLDELRLKAFEKPRGSAESKAFWREFYALKDTFSSVGYAYASTIHKAQGSTFHHAYVPLTDVFKNQKVKERNQLLYVGATRASVNLFICE